jgi:hypothetical protein
MNASSIKGKGMTITGGFAGVSSQESMAEEERSHCGSQIVGCVKVEISCTIENKVSFEPIIEKLFNIFPYYLENIHLMLIKPEFPASELGRNITIFYRRCSECLGCVRHT